MKVIAFIFARGGSKGIPRKNLADLAGKSLLERAVETASRADSVTRVVVSTDDDEIAAVARAAGAEVPFMRPTELAGDRSPEWLSWQHAIREVSAGSSAPVLDVFLSVPTTSPFRCVTDLNRCVDKLSSSSADIVITVTETARHPMFNMVTFDAEGYARLAAQPPAAIAGRQSVPYQVYDMTTVAYAADPGYVLRANSIFEGKVSAVTIPTARSLDIDTELDLEYARFLWKHKGQWGACDDSVS